ncbi:MAG TPA: mechanosensitive ion channel family protein [Gemmatimonadaceae bacterium]
MLDILDKQFYGASVTRWLVALATLFGTYLVLRLLQRWVKNRVGKWAARTETEWDDLIVALIGQTRWYFLVVLALEAAARVVPGDKGAIAPLRAALMIVSLLQAGVWGNGLIAFLSDRYTRLKTNGDVASRATVYAIGYGARIALWVLLVVSGLDFFNVKITALLTGLGIGGVAVALAAQNVLSDLFAAIAIVLDRPFVVGDSITIEGVDGDVEQIGLKTTRIRSVNGEQIVIANADLLKSRIRNYGRMQQRRSAFHLDIAHGTGADVIQKIPGMIKAIVEAQPNTRFERCHLLSFTESALRFEVVYFVLQREYRKYADIQQAILLEILRRFDAERISFALPSRAVFLRGDTTSIAERT